ncbi:MAG TPA: ABC transporter permease [Acidimicrobiia bacterium]|nr:ABC transporter permease [Acidimicrobiia bacterium]
MTRRAIAAQSRVELLLLLRRGENVLVTLLIPIATLVFFTKVDAVTTDYDDPVDFLVPGILALSVMAAAMVGLGISTAFERRYGVLKRLGSTPLGRSGLLAAKTTTVLALEAIQVVLVLVTGVLLGWEPQGSLLVALAVIVVGTVAFAGLGLLMAGTLRADATLAVANGLFLVLLFLGGMAYPLDDLPRALEQLAGLLPAAALSETLRSVLTDGAAFPTGSFAVLVTWAVATPLAASTWFRWEE